MMMKEPRAIWGIDGWAEAEGWILAHCANPATHEYNGPLDVWVSVGTGLPACAFLDAPPTSEPGKTIVRPGDTWMLVDDHRGQTAYDKQTRAASVITEPGEVPVTQTLVAPSSPFDVWDEERDAWVKNIEAESNWQRQQAETQRNMLMAEANQQIAILADAVELGMATDTEQAAYIAWRQYRVELSRLDLTQQPITWPPTPATAS
ncbi:tail fiber assembly protein [Aeromonas caviae]|uniref:tail fiber assembly protein n=1 Tax=Aeromonas caviae TaxID=648 RepID=UPI002B2541EE|nr:tail fiber assembly protein [Aeromonas caviae]MEA9442263.1 tail fiber assembly protein [Aeromonas caviae]